jgi:hypothetical protein
MHISTAALKIDLYVLQSRPHNRVLACDFIGMLTELAVYKPERWLDDASSEPE